ncbi:NADH-quinone oxidoreductase subunit NuoE [Devosia sp. YIM 151766]|uniref:NADH-quinone oxidoreductase subunit NuoE n=1 Tax=Devosia sp. YIM 151766 TaxID=3017325 RepID=UPI00255D0809|nr:NADH-quinone oxidoreductase subunit NuoE [Devosia sp. YIM 151766]WIY54427.1 NADH-quinone oxidoreductase subunit NuoE [Devosia sp. YIM 151766]
MSVRRLADESVQPASFAFTAENLAWAEKRIGLYPPGRQQSAVIPLLMRAQDQDGWVTRATIEAVAEMLSMPYIRVLEVATFYTQFQLQPVGTRAHVQVCGTTPCMLRGAEGLIEVCKSKIHPEPHRLNEDGTLSWEEVECAGVCVNAPMVAIFHDTYEDLTAERLEEIIDAFHAGKGESIKPGPQIDRQFSGAEGGETSLLEKPTATREKFVPPPAPDAPATSAPAAATPTTAAKPKDVAEENAPALKGAPQEAKVSEAKAETERKAAAQSAKGTSGEPNKAMREDAVGAESLGSSLDGGKAVGKATVNAPADGGAPASVKKTKSTAKAGKASAREVSPTADHAGTPQPLFDKPAGAADDLKLIAGIGPVLEGKLNALGITRFEQIAKFKKADITRVDEVLNFRGRIERDDWVKQAKALAKGGVEEYRKVFGKDPR